MFLSKRLSQQRATHRKCIFCWWFGEHLLFSLKRRKGLTDLPSPDSKFLKCVFPHLCCRNGLKMLVQNQPLGRALNSAAPSNCAAGGHLRNAELMGLSTAASATGDREGSGDACDNGTGGSATHVSLQRPVDISHVRISGVKTSFRPSKPSREVKLQEMCHKLLRKVCFQEGLSPTSHNFYL